MQRTRHVLVVAVGGYPVPCGRSAHVVDALAIHRLEILGVRARISLRDWVTR